MIVLFVLFLFIGRAIGKLSYCRCCSDGGVHKHMVDVLIMLTEAYYCLNRYV